jgi:hypothetical protein
LALWEKLHRLQFGQQTKDNTTSTGDGGKIAIVSPATPART